MAALEKIGQGPGNFMRLLPKWVRNRNCSRPAPERLCTSVAVRSVALHFLDSNLTKVNRSIFPFKKKKIWMKSPTAECDQPEVRAFRERSGWNVPCTFHQKLKNQWLEWKLRLRRVHILAVWRVKWFAFQYVILEFAEDKHFVFSPPFF